MFNTGVCKTKNGNLRCVIRDSNTVWKEGLSLILLYCAHKPSLNESFFFPTDLKNEQSGDLTFPNLKKILLRLRISLKILYWNEWYFLLMFLRVTDNTAEKWSFLLRKNFIFLCSVNMLPISSCGFKECLKVPLQFWFLIIN